MTTASAPAALLTGDPLTWPDDYLMSRREAAQLAAALGTPVSPSSLAKLAHSGGPDAPPLRYWGVRPRYQAGEFRRWIAGRVLRASSTRDRAHAPMLRAGEHSGRAEADAA